MKPFVYFFAAVYGLLFWGHTVNDPDLAWHLFGGAWMVEHRQLPPFDPVNSLNPSWHNYHWLAQLMFYGIWSAGGYALLIYAHGLLMACLFVVITDIAYLAMRPRSSNLLATVFVCLCALLIAQVTSVRPQMVALLLVALAVRELLRSGPHGGFGKLLCWSVLCANMHVYWVLIPALWAIHRVLLPAIHRRQFGKPLALMGVLSLAGFATPYGWSSYWLLVDYALTPTLLKNSIREFIPGLAAGTYAPIALVLCLMALARFYRPGRALASARLTLPAFGSALLAARSIKFISVFALLALPYLVKHSTRTLYTVAPGMFRRDAKITVIAIGALMLFCSYQSLVGAPHPTNKPTQPPAHFPVAACTELARSTPQHKADRDHVRVLTHFNYGGWCRWAAYLANPTLDFRVTTDGRTQFVPVENFQKSFDLFALKPKWRETLELWAPDAIVAGNDYPLSQILPLLPEWRELYRDEKFVVFTPSVITPPTK